MFYIIALAGSRNFETRFRFRIFESAFLSNDKELPAGSYFEYNFGNFVQTPSGLYKISSRTNWFFV